MVCAAVFELSGSDVNDTLLCALRNQMHEAEQILTGVTEAHAASGTGFVVGSGTGHVEGDHTLVLVPDIDHAVDFFIGRIDCIFCKQCIPVFIQLCEGGIDLRIGLEAGEQLFCRCFIDDTRLFPFLFFWIFSVAEHKDQAAGFSRGKRETDLVCGDRRPAACDGIAAAAVLDSLRIGALAVSADKGVPACVEAVDRSVDTEVRVVISALAVFGLVIDRRAIDLDLADA